MSSRGENDRSGQELADRFDVAQRDGGGSVTGMNGAPGHDGGKHPTLQSGLNTGGEPGHDPAARKIEETHDREKEQRDQDKRQERFPRPAAENPVIDLEHEDRPGEHEEVQEP